MRQERGGQLVVTIELPRSLLGPNDSGTVELEEKISTVGDAIRALEKHSPTAIDSVLDEQGKLRQHVNVFLNEENTRFLAGLDTPAPDGSRIFVLGAISGG